MLIEKKSFFNIPQNCSSRVCVTAKMFSHDCSVFVYLCATPMDDVIRGLIDLTLHLNRLLLVMCYLNAQNPKI